MCCFVFCALKGSSFSEAICIGFVFTNDGSLTVFLAVTAIVEKKFIVIIINNLL